MRNPLLPFLSVLLMGGCHTLDYTQGHPNICEVHHVAMFKRSVPFAHGMIPMSKVGAAKGEWKQRTDFYPHPGDCEPAADIVLPGQDGQVVVYVCPQCEAARNALQPRKQ